MLVIFDLTYSAPCIGKMVGARFKEKVGVREGGVESPHLFNMFISPLKQKLLDLHPRLCRLLDVIVAVILYADDAALPADSVEDLQLAMSIFEEFCNENRLFIAVPKTFLMVFHNAGDRGVIYEDSGVWIDGQLMGRRWLRHEASNIWA
jgi:hypothetical protein